MALADLAELAPDVDDTGELAVVSWSELPRHDSLHSLTRPAMTANIAYVGKTPIHADVYVHADDARMITHETFLGTFPLQPGDNSVRVDLDRLGFSLARLSYSARAHLSVYLKRSADTNEYFQLVTSPSIYMHPDAQQNLLVYREARLRSDFRGGDFKRTIGAVDEPGAVIVRVLDASQLRSGGNSP